MGYRIASRGGRGMVGVIILTKNSTNHTSRPGNDASSRAMKKGMRAYTGLQNAAEAMH